MDKKANWIQSLHNLLYVGLVLTYYWKWQKSHQTHYEHKFDTVCLHNNLLDISLDSLIVKAVIRSLEYFALILEIYSI